MQEHDHPMGLRERFRRWWNPAQWNDDHPTPTDVERAKEPVTGAEAFIQPQHGVGAESYDRVDVERDLRKP